jgi:hypothetical protein
VRSKKIRETTVNHPSWKLFVACSFVRLLARRANSVFVKHAEERKENASSYNLVEHKK